MPGASLALFADWGGMSRPKVKCYDLRSTRALRVEGDSLQNAGRSRPNHNFYPRPPGGGRPMSPSTTGIVPGFLSTPSGWRATSSCTPAHSRRPYFYPRPPGGGRLRSEMKVVEARYISIHALRVEGDPTMSAISLNRSRLFLSTPSGWRATDLILFAARYAGISIHGLRVEGDTKSAVAIHWNRKDFYPRPPGGGRH